MDKETLSNYGWIVICVLVLAVMIALASPFGNFVADAVKSTTQGLFDVNQSALNSTGLISIGDQSFTDGGNGGAGENGGTPVVPSEPETPTPVIGNATFSDGVTLFLSRKLTWEELQLEKNGTKYGYDASAVTDKMIGNGAFSDCYTLKSIEVPDGVTSIGNAAFAYCDSLTSITLPASVTTIGQYAFDSDDDLTNITFNGTTAQWNAISKEDSWKPTGTTIYITCTDGNTIA